jgi:hypothetical protein
VFEAFTDQDHALKNVVQAAGLPATPAVKTTASGAATVTINSNSNGADIEVDGAYVGSTPTTLTLPAGPHQIVVRYGRGVWQRTLQVGASSNVTVNAAIEAPQVATRKTHQ